MTTKLIIAGAAFLLVVFTGIWLGRAGAPYNGFLSTIHKLLSLLMIVFGVIIILKLNKLTGLSGFEFFLIILMAFTLVSGIASGAILSDKTIEMRFLINWHKLSVIAFTLLSLLFSFVYLRGHEFGG